MNYESVSVKSAQTSTLNVIGVFESSEHLNSLDKQ